MSQNALIFGASGGLATELANKLLSLDWKVDLVTRASRQALVERTFHEAIQSGKARVFTVSESYTEFAAEGPYRAYIFTQALFEPMPLIDTATGQVEREIEVGLTGPISITRSLLKAHPRALTERCDFAFIGSTSAYAGFKKTAAYCAVKHGLLGFVRAMNDEYTDTETRFWLFSMGTMNTEMGALLTDQDATSFLQTGDVAARIAESLSSTSNLFEPEIVMRRRKVRFKAK